MQTLFIGFAEDSVDPFMQGIAIRIAYLLSTQLIISGDISNYFILEQGLRNMSYENKLKYIDDREKYNPDPPLLYEQHKRVQKLYQKSKSHQKEFIVYKKKMERSVEQIFNRMVDDMVQYGKELGLLDLRSIEDSSSFAEYYIRYQDPEDKKDKLNKLSDVLQFKLEDIDNMNRSIFVLNYPLFFPEFSQGNDLVPELNKFSEKGFLQELFTFPNYNDFSVTDLNTIRFEVNESLEYFQQCISVFTTLDTKPAEAYDRLHTHVLPATKILLENISKINFVSSYNKMPASDSATGKIYLGMLPRHVVFKYFEFTKASQQETITILNELPDEEKNQLVSVLITCIEDGNVDEETVIITKEEPLPLKRSLSID